MEIETRESALSKTMTAVLEGRLAGWIINLVVIPFLLVLVVLLPPISLLNRVLDIGYNSIPRSGGTIRERDGTLVAFPAGLDTSIKAKLNAVPRADLLRSNDAAAAALPPHLEIKSPYYQLTLQGTPPTRLELTIPIPNDAEPLTTLDIYAWTGKEWRWTPSHVSVDDDKIYADLSFPAAGFAVMQTATNLPSVSADVTAKSSLSPQARQSLAELYPEGLMLKEDGSIAGVLSPLSDQAIGALVIPTLSNVVDGTIRNDWVENILLDPEARARHTTVISQYVVRNLYPGINIDYRNVDPKLRKEFTAFVQELAQKLHAQRKALAITVAAPTQVSADEWETWAFDWRAIGQAADAVRIPAFSDPKAFNPGGPMEALLTWGVGEVNRYKLMLVLPTTSQDRLGTHIVYRSYADALALVAPQIQVPGGGTTVLGGEQVVMSLKGVEGFDGFKRSATTNALSFTYKDPGGQTRTVSLENADSLAYKIDLANRYHLRGVTLPGLLEEGSDPNIWTVLERYQRATTDTFKSEFTWVWIVQDATGKASSPAAKPFEEQNFSWTAPRASGTYTITLGLSNDAGTTVTGPTRQVALNVILGTPTPTPRSTKTTPTPAPGATKPAATPTPKPTAGVASVGPNPGFGYGIQAHVWSVDVQQVMNHIKAIGFGWVKAQVRWKDFESNGKGQIDWSGIDHFVNTANANGIKVLLSVVTAPRWARPPADTDDGPPANFQDYADFVKAIAQRYGSSKVHAIEVWNEQNLYYEWGGRGGKINAARYIELLKAAYAAIKSVDPNIIVVSGAPTPTGMNDGDIAIDDIVYLQQMYAAGLKNYSDAIGAHPSGYNCPADGDWQTVTNPTAQFRGPFDNRSHSWCFRGTMEGYRNVMLANGDGNKKIWATEFGWATVDGLGVPPARGYEYAADNTEAFQATNVVKAYQLAKSWGWVGVMFLWNLNYAPVAGAADEKAAFGIVRPNWAPRPVYSALQGMAK